MKKNWTLLWKVCQRTDKQLSFTLLFVKGMHFFIYDKHCVFLVGWEKAQNQFNSIVRECVLWMYAGASRSGHTHRGKRAGVEHTAGRTRAQLHISTIKHFWFNQIYEKKQTHLTYICPAPMVINDLTIGISAIYKWHNSYTLPRWVLFPSPCNHQLSLILIYNGCLPNSPCIIL